MSYFEFGPCGIEEYDDYKDKRVIEDSLTISSLYTAVFKMKRADAKPLTGSIFEPEAYKLHARIIDKEQAGKFGLHIVNFAVLGAKLEELGVSKMNLLDGFLTDPSGEELLLAGPDPADPFHATVTYRTSVGFFKEYEGGGGPLDKASTSDEVDFEEEVTIQLDRELALV